MVEWSCNKFNVPLLVQLQVRKRVNQDSWKVEIYEDEKGRYPFEEWRATLDAKTRARIIARIDRVKEGNFGDRKSLSDGLYELRLFFGPGYRIYYATIGKRIVLLLAGGSKKSQFRDIQTARAFWNRYRTE